MVDVNASFIESTKKLLEKAPWSTIINFVDDVNKKCPDTLELIVEGANFKKGTATIFIGNQKTKNYIQIDGHLSANYASTKSQTPSKNLPFIKKTNLALLASTNEKPYIAVDVNNPIPTIINAVIPDMAEQFMPQEEKPDKAQKNGR